MTGVDIARALAIPGLMEQDEMVFLASCAMAAPDGWIVDLGTYLGRSACLLAQVARARGMPCLSIDHFNPFQFADGRPGQANMSAAGCSLGDLAQFVHFHRGDSAQVPPEVDGVGFLFIDTDHSQKHLKEVLDAWRPHLTEGGIIALHDYDGTHPIRPVIDERFYDGPGWGCRGLVGSLIVFQETR